MRNEKQDIFTQECDKLSRWDYAIDIAERQIKVAEEKIKRLRISIRTFEEMRTTGEPFPGEEANQQGAET
jgi:hypothetical protein